MTKRDATRGLFCLYNCAKGHRRDECKDNGWTYVAPPPALPDMAWLAGDGWKHALRVKREDLARRLELAAIRAANVGHRPEGADMAWASEFTLRFVRDELRGVAAHKLAAKLERHSYRFEAAPTSALLWEMAGVLRAPGLADPDADGGRDGTDVYGWRPEAWFRDNLLYVRRTDVADRLKSGAREARNYGWDPGDAEALAWKLGWIRAEKLLDRLGALEASVESGDSPRLHRTIVYLAREIGRKLGGLPRLGEEDKPPVAVEGDG